jgi:hypothetical protein
MAYGSSQRVFALEIHGLRHPSTTTSGSPLLLSTGELYGVGTAVAALSSHTVLPCLSRESVSGYNWTSDPRQPIGPGGEVTVRMFDRGGLWGTQLIRNARAAYWDIETSRLAYNTTTLTFSSKLGAAPSNGQICWVEGEAIKIASAPSLVSGTVATYTCNITRAQCGSRAALHRLDPLGYYAGDDGSQDRMTLDGRPNFLDYRFTGSLWLFRLDQFGAVLDYVMRYVYVAAPPQPLAGRQWEFRLRDIGDLLAEQPIGSEQRTVEISSRLSVQEVLRPGYSASAPGDEGLYVPKTAYAYLTRLEAERLLREPLHAVGTGMISASMVNALLAVMVASGDVSYYVDIEAAGRWLYRLQAISYVTETRPAESAETPFVRLALELVAREPGRGVFSQGEGGDYADGWTGNAPGVPLHYGERRDTPPKLCLRVVIDAPPVEALLYLCCSDGGASADAIYDLIIGRVGAGLSSSWFNLGSTVASPIDDGDQATTALLERAQLCDEEYQYHLRLSDDQTLGAFLSADVCLLHSLLFGPLQSGLLTLRPWVRAQDASPVTLAATAVSQLEPGTKLGNVRALELQAGFKPLDLSPQYVRSVRSRDARMGRSGLGEVQVLRIWKQASRFTLGDEAVASGSLSVLIRAWLEVYGGEPVVLEVETTLDWLQDNAVEYLSFVTYSNDDVLSDAGTGVSGTWILLGYSLDWQTGKVLARIVLDTFNEGYSDQPAVADNVSAPALIPTRQPLPLGGTSYRIPVQPIADKGIDIADLAGGLFSDLVTAGGYIKVTCPIQSIATEIEGYLDAYGTIDAIGYDAGTRTSYIDVTFDASWERGGHTLLGDILTPGEAVLSLTDYRPDGTHPQSGATIQPPAAQLYNGGAGLNITKVAGLSAFDKVRHQLGD